MNLYHLFLITYSGLAKIGTNNGISVIDLGFARTLSLFWIAFGTVIYHKKHIINDVPKNLRAGIFLRCIFGVIAFNCYVYAVKILPVFIASIIFNSAPFWTSILGYVLLKEKV